MVKTKRKIGAILITAILAVALATGMFCFAGGGTISAFAEGDENATGYAVFVVGDGTDSYIPHADGTHIVFGSATGEEIAVPNVVSGVDGVTTVYLRIDIVSNVRTEPLIKFYWVDNTGIYIDKGTDSHSPADGYHGKGDKLTSWSDEMKSLYGGTDSEAQSGKYTMTFTLPQEQAVELEKTGKPYAPLEVSFNIEQIDLNGVDTDDNKNFYRAEPVNESIIYGQSTPTVKIEKKSGAGADAIYTEDKTVTFDYGNRNNLDAGSQVPVTVKGNGNYKGEFTVRFEIKRAGNKLGVSLSSWDYGAFAADKNKIAVNATEGAEKTQYTVTRKNEQGGFEEFDDVLTEFLLENGAYTNEVAEKLNGLVAGEYRLEAEIQETAIDNHTGIQYLHSDRINGYPFEVHKTRYAHPVLTLIAGVNDTYSGGELSMIINGFDSRFMDISFTGIRWQDGVLYATDAGTYTATITITNENCEWADNAESVTLKWTVNPKVLTRPTDDRTDFTINGSDQTYNPAGFDDRYMTITGNVRDDAGTTVVTVELKDKKNYVWDNGSTDAITFGWHIDTADVAFAVTVCVLAALILACAAVAVMQFISHRQRMTVFAEIGERQRREPEELNENNADGEPNNEGGNE